MKALKFALSSVALCVSLASFSQTDTTAKVKKDTLTKTDTTTAMMQQPATGTAGTSASESVVPKPNFGRYYIGVLGTYQPAEAGATAQAATSVTVTGDESNAGKVWVEGLTPAKFYALLKTPGTYKIPAQTQEEKKIAEGTLTYDDASKQVTICVGCGFKDQGATTATTTDVQSTDVTKGKSKNSKSAKTAKTVLNFTGTKVNQGSASAF